MATKAKRFRIAVEGATTDGREISRDWISQMAANYDPKVYGARINMEHIRGYAADSTFRRFGDVTAVEAEEIADGALKGKLALFGWIDPTPELVELTRSRQKIYTSIEVNPMFADTGEAYLVGLAVTDDPASLGTEALKFSAFKPMWDARKSDPTNFFTAAEENVFALETPTAQPDASAGALGTMKAFFEKFTASPTPPAPIAPVAPTPPLQLPTPANENNFAQIVEGLGLIGASLSALSAKVDSDVGAIRGEFGTLKTRLETTEAPNGFSRQPHGGGSVDAKFATDC